MRSRTFVVRVQDRPGVLNRVTSMCRRRSYNIDWLTVGPTVERGVSQITFQAHLDDEGAQKLEASLHKLVEVLSVEDETRVPCVVRELALVKVAATPEIRAVIVQLCSELPAKVAAMTSSAVTLEVVGAREQVNELLQILRPFGVVEIVRTAIALPREDTRTDAASDAACEAA